MVNRPAGTGILGIPPEITEIFLNIREAGFTYPAAYYSNGAI